MKLLTHWVGKAGDGTLLIEVKTYKGSGAKPWVIKKASKFGIPRITRQRTRYEVMAESNYLKSEFRKAGYGRKVTVIK